MNARKKTNAPSASGKLSGTSASEFINNGKNILHLKILRKSQNKPEYMGGIVEIYRRDVLTQKTRTVRLLGIKSTAKIIESLLGYEVQARHKRIQCPDLVTARYLKLFSQLGCRNIRLPYDPTLTARLIPVMESALESISDTVAEIFPNDPDCRQYTIRMIYAIVREELRNAD